MLQEKWHAGVFHAGNSGVKVCWDTVLLQRPDFGPTGLQRVMLPKEVTCKPLEQTQGLSCAGEDVAHFFLKWPVCCFVAQLSWKGQLVSQLSSSLVCVATHRILHICLKLATSVTLPWFSFKFLVGIVSQLHGSSNCLLLWALGFFVQVQVFELSCSFQGKNTKLYSFLLYFI